MSLEENKAIIRRLYEAFNTRNLALFYTLLAPDFVDYTHQLESREEYKQFHTSVNKGFPDIHEALEDIIAEGDKVWTRCTVTGTHSGEYRGVAPTGKKITITGVRIWHIVDGKVVGRETVYDMLDFYTQLGVIEYKGFPDEVK